MKRLMILLLFVGFAFSAMSTYAKKNSGKVQEVQFDGSDVDGTARNPDGSYMVQKKGVRFLPLYNVKNKVDSNMRVLAEYLR